MTTILARTLIVYTVMIISLRIMGKRQIGELEVSDLVTTLLISQIASLPITDNNIPILHAIIPIILLLFFEISSSAIIVLFPRLKKIFTARPSTLIQNGKICKKAMLESRLSLDELISELRQGGYVDIDEILYAILEKNGKITIIPKAKYKNPTCEQLRINTQEEGIFHIIIDNGTVNKFGLKAVGLTDCQLQSKLEKRNCTVSDVYLMMINDVGEERIVCKGDTL